MQDFPMETHLILQECVGGWVRGPDITSPGPKGVMETELFAAARGPKQNSCSAAFPKADWLTWELTPGRQF